MSNALRFRALMGLVWCQSFKTSSIFVHFLLQCWLLSFAFLWYFYVFLSSGRRMKEISESLSLSRSTTCLCKLFASRHFCRSLHLVEKRRLANAAQCVLCTSETIFGYRVVVKTRLHSLVCWKGTSISTFQFFRRMRYNKQQRLRPRFARERLTPLETSHDNLHSDHSARYWSVKGIFRNIRSLLSSFLLGIMESQLRTIFCNTYLHLYMYIYVSYVDCNSMHCTLPALVSITQNQKDLKLCFLAQCFLFWQRESKRTSLDWVRWASESPHDLAQPQCTA